MFLLRAGAWRDFYRTIPTGGLCLAAGLAALLAASPLLRATGYPAPQERPAATAPDANPVSNPMAVPGFWDPRRRPERPDLSRLTVIRFLTETDYPPFNYAGADGNPAGFNVDLARLICEEIKVAAPCRCGASIRWSMPLNTNSGDAVIASIAATPDMRKRVDFSDPYYRTPARFVARRDAKAEGRLEAMEGKKVGAVAGTAHEAYLKALFTEAVVQPYPTAEAARAALKKGEIDLLFGDGVSLAFWLNGTDSAGCCEFRGGPIWRAAILAKASASRSGAATICCGRLFFFFFFFLNWALFRLWEKGASPICGCAISRSALTKPFDCPARRSDPGGECRLQQIAAGRRVPSQHFAGDENAGAFLQHEALVEFAEGNAAGGRDRGGDRLNAGEFDRHAL